MTYETFRYIFLGGAIACGIMVAISAVLFFTLRIPKVISDLSGRTARKAIEDIRLHNEQSGDKSYKSSAVNRERGKITDKISGSGRLIKNEESPFGTGVITEKISTQKLPPEETAGETSLLEQPAGETSVLEQPVGETSLLEQPIGETSLLDQVAMAQPAGETSVLGVAPVQAAQTFEQVFAVEYEITFIHTNEVIG